MKFGSRFHTEIPISNKCYNHNSKIITFSLRLITYPRNPKTIISIIFIFVALFNFHIRVKFKDQGCTNRKGGGGSSKHFRNLTIAVKFLLALVGKVGLTTGIFSKELNVKTFLFLLVGALKIFVRRQHSFSVDEITYISSTPSPLPKKLLQ